MALIPSHNPYSLQIHKLPQYTYIDALRWLPHLSTFTRHILLATYDADSSTSSLQTLISSPSQTIPSVALQASVSAPSRIASLKVSPSQLTPSKPLIAAATFSGSVLFYSADLINESLNFEFSVPDKGAVSGIDLSENGSECVSVGEDGRVNLVSFSGKRDFRRVFDSNGLVSYSSVKWASPVEFVTGAFGFGLHWWDQRKAGGPAGGSSGIVFAWDIRWPKQPVMLSGVGAGDAANSLVESDIWEVQYDNYTHSSKIINSSSSRVLPAMICSEDGILAVIEQGCGMQFGVGINSHLNEAMSLTVMELGNETEERNCIRRMKSAKIFDMGVMSESRTSRVSMHDQIVLVF
ncbi:hypothetical protein DH2020_010909 [Rehmannia glutinosa]|uniref:Nuclear pore complex protein NUP43 n=1 Tax=Rehmannia glutinosa TaxID=99300 RepID=A0ABR0XCL8_REHGL